MPKRKLVLLPFISFIICLLLACFFYSASKKKQNELNELKSKETRFNITENTNSNAGSFEDTELKNMEKEIVDFKNTSIILLTMGSIMIISTIVRFVIEKIPKEYGK